jgi:probable rRNA maturation factor
MTAGDLPSRGRVELLGLARYPSARDPGLRRWLERVVGELAPDADSVAVRFVGDRTMRRLSRVFRGKDATTDVLSFPGEATPDGLHLGDIVLSVPQAMRQAAGNGNAPSRELRVLLLHGVLHCLGYDHETDDGEMSRLEQRLRRRFLGDVRG